MTQTLKDPTKWNFDIDTGFGEAVSAESSAPPKKGAGGKYEGIETKPFDQLKDDKRMKITVFHWDGEKGGEDHIKAMQALRADPAHSDFVWFHVDVSTDPGAKSFKVGMLVVALVRFSLRFVAAYFSGRICRLSLHRRLWTGSRISFK